MSGSIPTSWPAASRAHWRWRHCWAAASYPAYPGYGYYGGYYGGPLLWRAPTMAVPTMAAAWWRTAADGAEAGGAETA